MRILQNTLLLISLTICIVTFEVFLGTPSLGYLLILFNGGLLLLMSLVFQLIKIPHNLKKQFVLCPLCTGVLTFIFALFNTDYWFINQGLGLVAIFISIIWQLSLIYKIWHRYRASPLAWFQITNHHTIESCGSLSINKASHNMKKILTFIILITLLSCNSRNINWLEMETVDYSSLPNEVKECIFEVDFKDLNKPNKYYSKRRQDKFLHWVYYIDIHRKEDNKVFDTELKGEYGSHLVIYKDYLFIPNHYNIYKSDSLEYSFTRFHLE